MSKIERALRKAEEEKRQRETAEVATDGPRDEVAREGVFVADFAELPNAPREAGETHYGTEGASEHFRKIAAKLNSYYESVGPANIVFTSAVSGEGKTTIAINCAVSLCQDFNLSVCLVDGDLHKPRLADYFQMNGSVTIVDVLRGTAEMDSAIQATSIKGLSLTTSCGTGSLALPLLNSERLGQFVRKLKSRFDFVIFDSAPILPIADTVALSKRVSGIVLVIESGKTRKKHIEQVFEQIDRDKVIGFVMNYKKHRMPEAYNYTKYHDYANNKQ